MDVEELAVVVDELVEVLQLQANELENLIAHVGQVTVHLPEESKMSVIRSWLSGLRLRTKALRGQASSATDEETGPATSSSK